MKKSIIFVFLAVVAILASGCSATNQGMREQSIKFELNSSDFILSDAVSGQATVVKVIGIDWARLFKSKAGFLSYPIVGGVPSLTQMSNMYAVYDMMEKHPGYDFVLYPQFIVKEEGVPPFYTKAEIKVTARLGKLKKR